MPISRLLALRPRRPALALIAAALLATPALSQAQDGVPSTPLVVRPSGPADEAVLTAFDGFRARNAGKLAAAALLARGHVLEPYVQYWQLLLGLDDANAEVVNDFLRRHAGSFVADRLRADWIRVLGKRADWAALREHYQMLVNEDADITCWVQLARWRLGDAEAPSEALAVWNQPRAWPDSCAAMVEHLLATGMLKPRDVWNRGRMLLTAGQTGAAVRTFEFLPPAEQPDAKLIAQLAHNPARALGATKFDFARRAHRELAVFGLGRMARNEPAEAIALFEKSFKSRLPAEDQSAVYATAALAAARRHQSEALGWFRAAQPADLSDEHLGWRARAAMREGNWGEVRAAIDAMSPREKADPTWAYWLGRALRESGARDEATLQFQRIAGQHNFYGKLAAEELGQSLAMPEKLYQPSADDVAAVERRPGLQRALALFRLEMRTEAVREWNWSLRGMDDRELLATAELARRNELWDRAINTADRTVYLHDFSVRFLAPYRQRFAEHAKSQGVDEAWVLGLVRQESRFIVNARSSAGASGLMQLMPATARMVARRIGFKDFNWARVLDPDVNILLGTSYMREVLDSQEGSPVLASAGYNAGPGRAWRWRAERPLEGAIYAETIPFNETRDYVKKVMSNTMYYTVLLGAEPRSLKSRMGIIPPRSGGAVTAATGQ